MNIAVPSGLKKSMNCAVKWKYGQCFLKICLSCHRLVVGGSGAGGVRLVVHRGFWGKTEQLCLSANRGQSPPSDILNSPYPQGTNTSLPGAEWPGGFPCVSLRADLFCVSGNS